MRRRDLPLIPRLLFRSCPDSVFPTTVRLLTDCAQLRLVGAFRLLVALERLGRIDVPERRCDDLPIRAADAEALGQDRDSERVFMSPIPGRSEVAEVLGVGFASVQTRAASPPYSLSIAAQSSCTRFAIAPGYRWIAGRSRNAASSSPDPCRRSTRRRTRPIAARSRAGGERLLDGHLLVEDEADEQGKRVARERAFGLVVVREVEPVGLRHRRYGSDRTECGGTNACTLRRSDPLAVFSRRRAPGSSGPSTIRRRRRHRASRRSRRGEHTLIQAPTGSGKTLAAFLYGSIGSIPARARACACCTCRR